MNLNSRTQLNPRWNSTTFVTLCLVGSIGIVCFLYYLDRYVGFRTTNELLVVLMLPVFYAAFYYPRWVYLLYTLMVELIVIIYVSNVDRNIYYSLVTITALLLMSMVACESIFVASQKRRDLENALLETEELYYRAIDALCGSPYYLNLWTDEYRIIGDGFKQITGYDVSTINRKWIVEKAKRIVPLGDLKDLPFDRALQKFCMERGIRWQVHYEIIVADGTSRWILDSAVQVFDKSGVKIIGAFGIFLDLIPQRDNELLPERTEHSSG